MAAKSMVKTLHDLALLGALHGSACAAEATATGHPALHARGQLWRMVREQELPGAQYVAVSADRTLLDAQVGVADAATGRPMRRETLQMAYSVTKIVTAIAVMQLVDDGKIELDAPLSRYWSGHPYGTGVTIRSLLAHTSGVPNPMPLDWFVVEGERLDREVALRKVLAKNPGRDADVGAEYAYSNVGYWLLEKAIESASGQDYARYVEQHIFERVGLPRGAVSFDLPRQGLATGHAPRMAPMNLVLHLMTPARYWASPHRQWSRSARVLPIGRAYGGLFCSASALAPVLQDLLRAQPRLLSAAARDEMISTQRTRDGDSTDATLGWVNGELHGVRYVGKQGGGLGFHANLRIYPQLGLATVLIANRTEISPGPIDARSDAIDAGFVGVLPAHASHVSAGRAFAASMPR